MARVVCHGRMFEGAAGSSAFSPVEMLSESFCPSFTPRSRRGIEGVMPDPDA